QFYPFQLFNDEVVFHAYQSFYTITVSPYLLIDPELYNSYDSLDLRRNYYFTKNPDGLPNFRGNYTGDYELFSGIAVDELMLTVSECHVREGKTDLGLEYLNKLLKSRWTKGMYIPIADLSSQEA